MRRTCLVSIFLALSLLGGLAAARADGIDFSLTWAFDSWASGPAQEVVYLYSPGETAVVDLNLTSQSDLTLKVERVRLIAEWMGEGDCAELVLSPPVKVTPGETVSLGSISVKIPGDLSPGKYYYEFQVDVLMPYGGEWSGETYTVTGFVDLLIVPGRAIIEVDYDTAGGFSFSRGDEIEFQIHLANRGAKGTVVEYVRIYPGWPGESYEGEFFDCLAPGDRPSLDPGEEIGLRCSIPIPSGVPDGRYTSSLEVATVTDYAGERYTEFWSPGYGIDYEIKSPEPFIERYKEALGILTATASAISVFIGVYKKWKGGDQPKG